MLRGASPAIFFLGSFFMIKVAATGFFVTAFVALVLLTAGYALAQPRAGTVSSVTGDVHIERAGATITAAPGTAVNIGDRIVTGSNGRITIALLDNSKVELDASTTLVIDDEVFTASTRRTKLSLFAGLVHSLVSYTAPTPNFEVHTPNAVASARGTQYDTETDANQNPKYRDCRRFTQVTTYEGTVEVVNPTNPSAGSVQVPAGYKTLVACGYAPLAPSSMTGAAPAAGTAAGTTAAGATAAGATTAGIVSTTGVVAGVVAVGGVVGILAGTGAVGGGGGTTPTPVPKKSPKD